MSVQQEQTAPIEELPGVDFDVPPEEEIHDPQGAPEVMTLGDHIRSGLFADPPRVVLPHIALEGRVTMLAAQEKLGKSTLVAEGVAAISRGDPFLGKPTIPGKTLWLCLDEPIGDCVRRFEGYKAAPEEIYIETERWGWNDFEAVLDEKRPILTVVDTMTEHAIMEIDDFNSASQWMPYFKRLRMLGQKYGTAFILLHHVKKGSREYADSRAIGAGSDILLEMWGAGENVRKRFVKFRGRNVGHGMFAIEYVNGRYERSRSDGW